MTELYQGLYQGLLVMDLHIHCEVEQKRKQSGVQWNKLQINYYFNYIFFFVKRSYIYMILHRYF